MMKAVRSLSLVLLPPLLLALTVALGVWMVANVRAAQVAPDQQEIAVQSGVPQSLDPHRVMLEQDLAIARMLWRGLYQLEATPDGGVQAVPASGGRALGERQRVHRDAEAGAQVVR